MTKRRRFLQDAGFTRWVAADDPQSARKTLRSALTQAMRARDKEAVEVYRTTLAAIDNAEAVPLDDHHRAGAIETAPIGVGATEVARRVLDESDVHRIVGQEAAELRLAADSVTEHAPDAARRLRRQAALVDAVLRLGTAGPTP